MNFFKKNIGRPSQDELLLVKAIEQLAIQKGISYEDIPEFHTLDELIEATQLLESFPDNQPVQASEEIPLEEQPQSEPLLSEPPETEVIEHPSFQQGESIIDEPLVNAFEDELVNEAPKFIADDYNPFADPIIERSYTKQQEQESAQQDSQEEELILEEAKNSTLADLPDHTKRRAAEQTANTLLKGYAQLIPQPFKWFTKIREQKIEKMAFDGELDLSIEVSDGVTFEDYMRQTNEQIDEIFKVDEDTLADIREPLIEVLMEQNLELTPAQRLMAAIFSHLAQMMAVALKLRAQNNRILSYQKHLTHLYSNKGAAAA